MAVRGSPLYRQDLDGFWELLSGYMKDSRRGAASLKPDEINRVLVTALRNILSEVPVESMSEDHLKVIRLTFACLLHHRSAFEYQEDAMNILLEFILKLTKKNAKLFNELFRMIIPFRNLATSEAERAQLDQVALPDCVPLKKVCTDGTTDMMAEQTMKMLDIVLSFVKKNYADHSSRCIEIFRWSVLSVVYGSVAKKIDRISTTEAVMCGPVPTDLHTQIFLCLDLMVTSDFDFKEFCEKSEVIECLLTTLSETSQYPSVGCRTAALKVLTYLCNESLWERVEENVTDVEQRFLAIWHDIVSTSVLNGRISKEIHGAAGKFVANFFVVIFSDKDEDQIVEIADKLMVIFAERPLVEAVIYTGFVTAMIVNEEQSEVVWNCINRLAVISDFTASVNEKLAQYLALIIFPVMLRIDVPSSLEECKRLTDKHERLKQKSDYEWFFTKFRDMIDEPWLFVEMELTNQFGQKPGIPVVMPVISREMIRPAMVALYVRCMNKYLKKMRSERWRLFTSVHGFITVMIRVATTPPSVPCHWVDTVNTYFGMLLDDAASETDPNIAKSRFKLIASWIMRQEFKPVLTSEVLDQWYIFVILGMVRNDADYQSMALDAAIRTLLIGFAGSTCLALTVLSVCEVDSRIEGLRVLGSMALFDSDCDIPKEMKDKALNLVRKNPHYYHLRAENEFLTKGASSLGERARSLIFRLYNVLHVSHGFNPVTVIPVLSGLCVHDLLSEVPNYKTVCECLWIMCEMAEQGSGDSAMCLSGFIRTYSRQIKDDSLEKVIARIMSISVNVLDNEATVLKIFQLQFDTVITHVEATDRFLPAFVQRLRGVKDDPLNNWKDKLRKHAAIMMENLGHWSRNYPFPRSSLLIHNVESIADESIHLTGPNGRVVTVSPTSENNKFEVRTQTQVGQFKWNFKAVPHQVGDELHQEFAFPCALTDSCTTKRSSSQKEFARKINDLISDEEGDNKGLMANIAIAKDLIEDQTVKGVNKASARKDVVIERIASLCGASVLATTVADPEEARLIKIGNAEDIAKKVPFMEYRHQAKVGVIYVGKGITNQLDIFTTTMDDTSPHFREFLDGLGWMVDLQTHYVFSGGFKKKVGASDNDGGKSSVYFADLFNTVMFHVAPLMPTAPKDIDAQQIRKKYHIGNDPVHIVWNESGIEYDVQTITSQLNEIHIIIYPLQTGLFRVEVKHKETTGWFGPLYDSLVIPKRALPSLVRLTAIHGIAVLRDKLTPLSVPLIDCGTNIDVLVQAVCDRKSVRLLAKV